MKSNLTVNCASVGFIYGRSILLLKVGGGRREGRGGGRGSPISPWGKNLPGNSALGNDLQSSDSRNLKDQDFLEECAVLIHY